MPPPDHAQRQRALNVAHSFIVQAPAGSGKTELLVRRFLALLACVEAPEQILAITFTKKATAEMRKRISDALRGNADNPELRALAAAALANDKKHGWRIIDNTRRLRIQTIDAFCNELVRRMPWSARFGAPPDIVDDPAPLYRDAAKRTLDHIEGARQDADRAQACARLLNAVDADWIRARDLLGEMLRRRDKWMPLLGETDADDRTRHEAMWREFIESELQSIADHLGDDLQVQIAELAHIAAANLHDAGEESPLLAFYDAPDFPAADIGDIDKWRAIGEMLLTAQNDWRKIVTKNQGFPAGPEHKANKARIGELLDKLRTSGDALCESVGKIRKLPGAQFSDAQWQFIRALVELLPLAAAELRLIFKAQNRADYTELTQRAALALGAPDDPTDLALAFDYRLSHLLMDEFQDTSSAHIDLLTKLTAGWQADDGRTLFLVGDPMQSIYRFREAEVANFLQVQRAGLGDIRPESIVLTTNFRSQPALVDWFNKTFVQVMPPQDDIANGAVRYAEAAAHAHINDHADHAADGEVCIHRTHKTTHAAAVATAIATVIKEAQQKTPAQSIAVLGRTRTHLHAIAEALHREGVSFQAVDLQKLNDRAAIRDLLGITRALASPTDRIAWLGVLRAPWCGLTLADLTALCAHDHNATIMELMRDDKITATLSADGRARLVRVEECMTAAVARCGRIGMRQNVEAAWLALGGPATMEADDLGDCQRYLDLLDEMESNRIDITSDNLNVATEELWARGGDDSQVQLLTIHKAKGLEFDAVFLPYLERTTKIDKRELLRWRKLPQQLLIAPLPTAADRDDPFYRYLEHLEAIHAQNELGRLLYVACTRARKHLHLFASVEESADDNMDKRGGELKPPPARSLLKLLWPSIGGELNDAPNAQDAPQIDAQHDGESHPLYRLPHDFRPPRLPPTVGDAARPDSDIERVEFFWADDSARIIGIVIHQILQHIDDYGWAKWRAQKIDAKQKHHWRRQLMDNGIYGQALDAALLRVVEAIEKMRDDPRAAWLFSPDHRDIKTEWPLTAHIADNIRHFIIDRSFIDANGVRWIIDFKSGDHKGGDLREFLDREQQRHLPQMSRYAAALAQFQNHPIKLGLYFPAVAGWREWAA